MSLQTISLLHVGDVHFPDFKTKSPLVDVKDKEFPKRILSRIVVSREQRVIESILALLDSPEEIVAGVLFTGDLTSRGCTEGYQDCVNYLTEALRLKDDKRWKTRRLVVVPGNHDIERPGKITGGDVYQKFEKARDAWDIARANTFHYRAPISILATAGDCAATVIPLNTCLGCGEFRFLPLGIRKEISEALVSFGASLSEAEKFLLLGERLDTPAISGQDIQSLRSEIAKVPKGAATLVMAHHPILAQPVPRIDAYTELINAGHLRRALLETRKNVIYLHGHIHQDPLEVIGDLAINSGKVFSISAPEFSEGFNVINLIFSARGTAMGLEVIPYRFKYGGPDLDRLKGVKACLISPAEVWNEASDPLHGELLKILHSPREVFRFDDLLVKLNTSASSVAASSNEQTRLRDELEVLDLLGLIEISNRDSTERNWQIRRVAP